MSVMHLWFTESLHDGLLASTYRLCDEMTIQRHEAIEALEAVKPDTTGTTCLTCSTLALAAGTYKWSPTRLERWRAAVKRGTVNMRIAPEKAETCGPSSG